MSRFNLDYAVQDLRLDQPFTISRGTKNKVTNVFVRLCADGVEGYGEAAPNTRYDEDAGKVIRFLDNLSARFFDEVEAEEELVRKLDQQPKPIQSAKSAIEMAWLDWKGKKERVPLWKQWQAPSPTGPVTSYTIGLDSVEVMQQKTKAAAEYPIIKVKLGTGRDKEIIKGIREVTDKPIRVDANEGWKTLDEARDHIRFLTDHNIELIEQPMPAFRFEDMIELKAFSPIPLAADESFMGDESPEEIARAFDVINIKLMKIGSMVKARQVIRQAKTLGLNVMIGCMIESSLANTAGAILSLWTDYADLDGHLLIKDDPVSGLMLAEGKHIMVSDRPGLGIGMKSSSSWLWQ